MTPLERRLFAVFIKWAGRSYAGAHMHETWAAVVKEADLALAGQLAAERAATAVLWEQVRAEISSVRNYEAAEGRPDGDEIRVGLASGSIWGPSQDPKYEPYELAEAVAAWLHEKCDAILALLLAPGDLAGAIQAVLARHAACKNHYEGDRRGTDPEERESTRHRLEDERDAALDRLAAEITTCRTERDEVSALKDRKGGDLSEWPEDLRIRQFPGSVS
jgi:hypothetical protein